MRRTPCSFARSLRSGPTLLRRQSRSVRRVRPRLRSCAQSSAGDAGACAARRAGCAGAHGHCAERGAACAGARRACAGAGGVCAAGAARRAGRARHRAAAARPGGAVARGRAAGGCTRVDATQPAEAGRGGLAARAAAIAAAVVAKAAGPREPLAGAPPQHAAKRPRRR
jgi:hypothetical protein